MYNIGIKSRLSLIAAQLMYVSLEMLVLVALAFTDAPAHIASQIGFLAIGYLAWYSMCKKAIMQYQIEKYGFWIS
ncbi:MAG: hypothetical protein CMP47_12340 [Rickettsiales bacterium]|nr:hypothetical protein [Rickettsiales bacterium]|tara:strand:+ start:1120 stop:1344 length:225 start_codon:yes stop_codon:yes gene_type:complete